MNVVSLTEAAKSLRFPNRWRLKRYLLAAEKRSERTLMERGTGPRSAWAVDMVAVRDACPQLFVERGSDRDRDALVSFIDDMRRERKCTKARFAELSKSIITLDARLRALEAKAVCANWSKLERIAA